MLENKMQRCRDVYVNQGQPPNAAQEELKMTTAELATKITSLKELKRMTDEFETEITAIEDEIKAEMTAQGVNEMIAGVFKVRWTPVMSKRFDSSSFKARYADLYEQFTKQTAKADSMAPLCRQRRN